MAVDFLPDDFGNVFDDHPSLDASLEDFEEEHTTSPPSRPPAFGIPSTHSGFRSECSVDPDDTLDTSSTAGDPWSPPGFKRAYMQQQNHQLFPASMPGSAWYRRQPYLRNAPELRPTPGISPAGSREPSPQYEDAIDDPDLILPASIPLPPGTDSPLKGRSVSPEPERRDYRRDQQHQQQQRWDGDNNKEDESTLTNCNFPLLRLSVLLCSC
jgi:hypothetical protein